MTANDRKLSALQDGDRPVIILQPDMIPITLKEYAKRHGLNEKTVGSQADRGIIPTIQLGKAKTRYVNQALMIVNSLKAGG